MSLIDKYLNEGEEKIARFNKKLRQLFYFTSRNTSTTVNADDIKMAKAIIKKSGVKQTLVTEEKVDEVMGYRMKPKDQKLIKAFIDGATSGEGKALWIEGDYLYGPSQSSTTDYVAKRDGNYISVGTAYGNVSQTWINYIRKQTPKAFLR